MAMICTLVSNALSVVFGAWAGAYCAYFFMNKVEDKRNHEKYVTLLLILHDSLESIYDVLSNIPMEYVKEKEGIKLVELDLPLPDLSISDEQMYSITALAPDKDIPIALLKMKQFILAHNLRVQKDGKNILSLLFLQSACAELQGMLLSVKVQYEQATGESFPTAAGSVSSTE